MKIEDLQGKNVVIWGTGREARAAVALIHARLPGLPVTYADDAQGPDTLDGFKVMRGDIAQVLADADVIVKSPGISLYDPRLAGKNVTSLMNLWFTGNTHAKTICISGTKGKSTTSTLLTHVLAKSGRDVTLSGNIGQPLSAKDWDTDYLVIEVSSYQAANFDGAPDIAVVTNLYEEHLDWHGGVERYYADKLNILTRAKLKLIGAQAQAVSGYEGATLIEKADAVPKNAYLHRAHNLENIAAVLAVTDALGIARNDAVAAMEDFNGLPHRQFELGTRKGILYVDDSIATTPQATHAALEVYRNRPVTLIAGGFDRGIDYTPLVLSVMTHDVSGVICLGPSGERICEMLRYNGYEDTAVAANMAGALKLAREVTPAGGVILLSPAAPSYGMFTDFQERGKAFAAASGFSAT